jgi:hypothetical protein
MSKPNDVPRYKPKAELHLAFFWVCDHCGYDQYCRGETFTEDDWQVREVREELGLDDDDEGRFISAPNEVECRACGTKYETEEFDG